MTKVKEIVKEKSNNLVISLLLAKLFKNGDGKVILSRTVLGVTEGGTIQFTKQGSGIE